MNAGVESCDHDAVERIAHGRYTEACVAIGQANLPTILAAEQRNSDEVAAAQASGEPHRGYVGRLKLVRGRRRRLQAEARAQTGPPDCHSPAVTASRPGSAGTVPITSR